MKSFKNELRLKELHVEQAKKHYEQDMLIAGTYGETDAEVFRGCSVGCFAYEILGQTDDNPHKIVADDRGLPEWLIHLQDRIFEGLPLEDRKKWHVQLAEAIPVGIDLEPVRHKLAIMRMDKLIALQQRNIGASNIVQQTIDVLNIVRQCHEAELSKDSCDWAAAVVAADWSSWSAWSASASSASAWSADAASASARAAAWGAGKSVLAAAESAARSVSLEAWVATEAEWYRQERDNLLSILGSE
jgi:hypothetical protein